MRFDPTHTVGELLADGLGLSPADAIEVRAFAVWLERTGPPPVEGGAREVDQPGYAYAFGNLSGLDYLQAVAPAELPPDLIGPERKRGSFLSTPDTTPGRGSGGVTVAHARHTPWKSEHSGLRRRAPVGLLRQGDGLGRARLRRASDGNVLGRRPGRMRGPLPGDAPGGWSG